jgi:succinate dehydrogenase / fumarate reductase, membrane anchor subunit
MVRPRRYAEAKAIYANGELLWWVFMRVSGVLLLVLASGHIFFNNIHINVAEVDYAYVATRFSKSWVKVYDSFLLFLAMLHGVNGARYSLEDYIKNPPRRFWVKVFVYTLAVSILLMGVMTLWAFSYKEMGDAIRALPNTAP